MTPARPACWGYLRGGGRGRACWSGGAAAPCGTGTAARRRSTARGSWRGRPARWWSCSRWPATAPGGSRPLRPQGAVERDGRGDPLHHHRPHLLEEDVRQPVADALDGRPGGEHLAGRGKLHDPGGDVDVVAYQVVAPPCRLPVVDAHAHPEGQLLGGGLAGEAS